MATPYRVKRRAAGGATGAPSTLLQSELAYSEVDQILYIGQGTGGTATVVAIGGPGAYLTSATAASTYLTSATASSTYLTQSSASSTYLTQASAASTYVTQASASSYATQTYVNNAISSLVNGAGTALDTLKELADALGNDASFSTTISTSLGNKADRTLSNLTDAGTARTSLGLGSMATQAANNVAITGGSIDGVTLDGGVF